MTNGWTRTLARPGAIAVLLALALPAAAQTPDTDPPQRTDHGPASVLQRAIESRTKGGKEADIVVFEIADFQCPYCAQFSATVAPELDARYIDTGLIQWVFVNLPLHDHPQAWHAAEAALCAGAAGGSFWAMHDRLFADQDAWSGQPDPGSHFARYAAELGVPAQEYAACTEDDRVASLILQDFASAVSAGIDGTPTFIIMKDQQVLERLVGVQPVEEWARILDEALER